MISSDFPNGAAALAKALAAKTISSREAVTLYLARIGSENPRLRAYIHVMAEPALAAAQASDKRRTQGKTLGPLDGIPIAIKDNIDVAGVPTTGGIEHYRHNIAGSDAFVTSVLKAGGAVILGKLNMHEAALGATSDNPWFGRCENPLRAGFTPGGSSGGSGAAVAAGLCAAALGSDTLGSVRVPASYCGVFGFKPSYGRISTRGVMPLSWSFDHVGILSPRVEDLALMQAVCASFDKDWPHARGYPAETVVAHRFPRGFRLGVPALHGVSLEPAVAKAWGKALDHARQLGATLIDLPLPDFHWSQIRREAFLVSEAEAVEPFATALAANPKGFSEPLRKMLAFGARQTPERVAQARERMREVTATVQQTYTRADAWIMPTTPQRAFAFDTPVPVNQADLTGIANIAKLAAVAVPVAAADGELPASVQFLTAPGQDNLALALAQAFANLG